MNKSSVKMYVGCSLTSAPKEFIRSVEKLKSKLKKSYDVYDFIGLEKGTSEDVYNWDIKNCLLNCDFFVAICDHPSLGLGYELGTAIEAFKKPVLALAHKNTHVSRLLLGIDAAHFRFERYDEVSQIEELILASLEEHGLIGK